MTSTSLQYENSINTSVFFIYLLRLYTSTYISNMFTFKIFYLIYYNILIIENVSFSDK